jgi:deoxyribonuclease-4
MLIGAHVSSAGGLANAAKRGAELDAACIQIFNQSPRMWRPTAYGQADFVAFRQALEGGPVKAVLIHAVYLLNCASQDPQIRERTLASMIQSLRVGAAIGAAGVVLHPGSAKGEEVGAAIARAGELIAEALSQTDGCELHLEDTAGAGGTLGRSFEELGALIGAAGGGDRLGICLDSCHLLASGYEIATAEALASTLDECDRVLGLDRLRSLHLNDSLTPLGSNRDRHAPPGQGELGEEGLAVFLSEPRFERLACVLETGSDDGRLTSGDLRLAEALRERGKAARGPRGPHGSPKRARKTPLGGL